MFLIPASSYSVRTTRHKGRGAFARQDIPAGTVIGDYLGTLNQTEDEDEPLTGLYAFSINDTIDVFADPKSIGIHLINHSCMPNCDVFSLDDHILYVATRLIFKGEELSVDYSLDPPDTEMIPCSHTCRCGTIFCRGTMHVSAEAQKRWARLAPAESKSTKNKAKLGPLGSQFPPLQKYPSVIKKDYAVWDIYANPSKKPIVVSGKKFPSEKQIRALLRETGRPLLCAASGFKIMGMFNGVVFGNKV